VDGAGWPGASPRRLVVTVSRPESPVIYRCELCNAVVHPSEPERPVAWCSRCGRPVGAREDGGLS